MTEPTATLQDTKRVTPEQLAEMTPSAIDAMNAALYEEYARIDAKLHKAWDHLYGALLIQKERVRRGRGWSQVWPIGRDEAEERARQHLADGYEPDRATVVRYGLYGDRYAKGLREALEDIEALRGETQALNQGPGRVLGGEWVRRGGWPRFFKVTSSNDGHIHKGHGRYDCPSFRDSTTFGWHPELSGLTEKDAVTKLGPYLCTHCYPSAPTEWKQDPEAAKLAEKAKQECPGSRTYAEMDERMARRISRYATCPVCGEGVNVTSGGKLRAHKPKEAAPAAPEAPQAAEEPSPAPEPAVEAPEAATAPAKARSAGVPTATTVGNLLRDAGFRRHEPRRGYEGAKVAEQRDRGHVVLRWVESDSTGARRMAEAGLSTFGDLPESPYAAQWAAAYRDVLAARYRVEGDGTHLRVYALDVPRRPAKGRPLRKNVAKALREARIPVAERMSGYSTVTGCALVQEHDHVRIQVRPWEVVHDFTEEELSAAASPVEAALTGAGYAYTRHDDVSGAVFKVTGKAAREGL